MKNKSYYGIFHTPNYNNILAIPTVKKVGNNYYRVNFDYEADLCVELATTGSIYKSYGTHFPIADKTYKI